LIVVIRYDYNHHSTLRSTYIARDSVYGACSFAFLLLVDLLARDVSNQDPRIITEAKIEEETRRFLLRVVESAVTTGRQLPDFRDVVHVVLQDPDTALLDTTKQRLDDMPQKDSERLRGLHKDYLERVGNQFGNLKAVDLAREF
jgi:hypothetical protein